MTFGLFTHMAPRGSIEHIHVCVPSKWSGGSLPVLLNFPSGGTCFPTNSPFTLAWGVSSIRLFVGTCSAYRPTTPSSTCLIHFRSCGSSSEQTPFRLLTLEPMISPLDVFGPRVVGSIFRKVNDTLVIAMELKFLLLNSQLYDELLHPDYFLTGFRCGHILGFRGRQCHRLL